MTVDNNGVYLRGDTDNPDYNLKKMGWYMQDLRKHVWRVSHGSYWRFRYALAHPIRPK